VKSMPGRIIAAPRTVEWTKERIARLATPDIAQLRVNAERLNDPDVIGRCDEVLAERKEADKIARRNAKAAAAKPAAAKPAAAKAAS